VYSLLELAISQEVKHFLLCQNVVFLKRQRKVTKKFCNFAPMKQNIMTDGCNHQWEVNAAFAICRKCGQMILSSQMRSVSGTIRDDDPLNKLAEDAMVQSKYRKKNDKDDVQ